MWPRLMLMFVGIFAVVLTAGSVCLQSGNHMHYQVVTLPSIDIHLVGNWVKLSWWLILIKMVSSFSILTSTEAELCSTRFIPITNHYWGKYV